MGITSQRVYLNDGAVNVQVAFEYGRHVDPFLEERVRRRGATMSRDRARVQGSCGTNQEQGTSTVNDSYLRRGVPSVDHHVLDDTGTAATEGCRCLILG